MRTGYTPDITPAIVAALPKAMKILSHLALMILLLFVSVKLFAQTESEPNGSFATANVVNMGTPTSGSVDSRVINGNYVDQHDYFKITIPEDGSLEIYLSGTNQFTSNGYLYMYVYDSRQASGQILSKYVGNTSNVSPGGTITDTVIIQGRAADEYYLLLNTSGVFSYTFSYNVTNTSTNDAEPNNTFDDAIWMNRLQEKVGHIGYRKGGTSDADDYYATVLPYDGTLTIYVNGTNKDGNNGYMYMYGYDRRKGGGQIFAKYISNNSNIAPNTTIYDTIKLYGRASDTFYYRIISSASFQYSFHYDVLDTSINDSEPNDGFENALPINIQEQKQGHIGYVKNGSDDASDYYLTVLPNDGTLKIMVSGINRAGHNGYLYMYGYDRRKQGGQVFARYIANNSNIPPGTTIYDTIYMYGRAADTFYFRVSSAGAFEYQLEYDILDTSENDAEPNNSIDEAIQVAQMEEKKGHIGYVKGGTPDVSDYYRTVIPIDGTLKIFISGTNRSGSNGYLYMYGYDRRKHAGQIFGTYVSGNSNIKHDSTIHDTITIYGVLADTFYFRVTSSGAFSYQISYNTVVTSQFDPEPNNTFAEAVPVRQGILQNGQIGYTLGGNTDASDYYVTTLPLDGTVQLIVEGTNNGGGNGYMYLYAYDGRKNGGQLLARYIGNTSNVPPNQTIHDTLYIYGRAADSFYLRMTSSGPFSYSMKYNIIDTSTNDAEPNNNFDEALPIQLLEEKQGHINYVKRGAGDDNDYYRAILPYDGTLKIMVQGRNRSGGNGYLYMYVMDRRKAGGQFFAKYISNSSNIKADSTIYDTIYLYGRAADTAYFRITSSGAFSYQISYDVIDTSENDIEPNNTFAQALAIEPEEVKRGHIGYAFAGTDDGNDYYRTALPKNGTLKIIVQGKNQWGNNGYLYMYVYDRRQGSGQILAKYISNTSNITPGSIIHDTIYLHGRAADTTYFRFISSGAFSYSISYEMADTSENDIEPNNSFEEATFINTGEEKQGNIGYRYAGIEDYDDYYKTVLPYDGTVNIIIQGTNTFSSNGYLYMYAYDRRKGGGQILSRYISNSSNIAPGVTIYDTIQLHCRAADTMYFRITSANSFQYKFHYLVQDTSANDIEPNGTFETATPAALGEEQQGHIGYIMAGGADNQDHYVTAIPARGSVRIITRVTNTSGNNGYVYVYGFDRRKGSGQIFGRYIHNNIPPNVTVIDTFNINCTTIDTLYYRLTSSGCYSYSFTISHIDNDPVAAFTYNQAGSLHEFVNQSTNATSYIWKANDSILTTNIAPPLLSFKPGLFEIRLITRNAACNFVDTAYYPLVVKGLDTITPSVGGQGNVLFTAYGGGFNAASRLRIRQGGTVIMDSVHYVNEHGNIFAALLDLHLAPLGVYDVELVNPDTTYKKVGGFTLVAPITKLRSQIIGRDLLRANTNSPYSVRVYNEGNTMAGLVEVFVLFPEYMQVTLLDSLVNIVGPQLSYVNLDTFPIYSNVTTQRGYPINGRLYSYFIAGIPAGGFRDLSFMVNSGLGQQSIYVWIDGPWSGSNYTSQADKCYEAKLKLVLDLINDGVNVIPGLDCAWSAVKAVGSSLYSLYSWATGGSSETSTTAGGLKNTYGLAKNCAAEIAAATGVGIPAGLAIEIVDVGGDIAILGSNALVNYNQVEIDCPPDPEEPKKKPVDVRNSFDPNMKSGPAGIGLPRYIPGSERLMNYTIFFENVDTATLPAQDVIVTDTLDKTRFDLASFEVLSYRIGSKGYEVPNSAFSFSEEVPVGGGYNVRLSVNLDTASGIMTAHFKTIDTATGARPEEPLAGFLPPNVNKPEGEGSISFSINLLPGLPDGTVVSNQSSIIFDTNDPIVTETFSNTLDRNRPQSMVTNAYQMNDSTAVIKLSGSDIMSGFKEHYLYVSVNNGPWNFNRKINKRDSLAIPVILNNRYDFYSIGIDSVGNLEQKAAVSEAHIVIIPLAITLGNIYAENNGPRNKVWWHTVQEDSGDNFVVEKSKDGSRFESMTTLRARGVASAYEAFDEDPFDGRTYYRLAMVDRNGKYTYSKVVSAFKTKPGEFVLEAYPNPVKDQLTIRIHGNIDGMATITLVNAMGTLMETIPVNRNQVLISMDKYPPGLYFLRYTDQRQHKILRLTRL